MRNIGFADQLHTEGMWTRLRKIFEELMRGSVPVSTSTFIKVFDPLDKGKSWWSSHQDYFEMEMLLLQRLKQDCEITGTDMYDMIERSTRIGVIESVTASSAETPLRMEPRSEAYLQIDVTRFAGRKSSDRAKICSSENCLLVYLSSYRSFSYSAT